MTATYPSWTQRSFPCNVGRTIYAPESSDDHRIFNASDDVHGCTNAASAWMRRSGHLHCPTARLTGLDVDLEHPLEALRPTHRRAALGIGFHLLGGLRAGAPAPLSGRDRPTVCAIGRDQIAGSDSEQPKAGSKGVGQEARSNTPWYRVRFTRGLGIRAASRAMKSSGSSSKPTV